MKLRVVHISASAIGGAFVAAQRMVEAQQKSGQLEAVHLVLEPTALKHPSIIQVYPLSLFAKIFANVLHALEKFHFLFFEKNKAIRFQFSSGLTGTDISSHKQIKQADIIHLHWINKGFLSFHSIRKLAKKKPVVWTMHDMWAFTGGCHYSYTCHKYEEKCGFCPYLKTKYEEDLSTTLQAKKNSLFSAYPIAFVSPSRWLMELAKKSTVLKNAHLSHCMNCIDTSLYYPYSAEKKAALRKKYTVNQQALTVLFVAANVTDERKGISYLCDALTALAALPHFKNIELTPIIVGKNASIFEALKKQLPSTLSCGYVQSDEIINIYNLADIFIIPSLEDNLPNTVVEALACGVPVIGFNTGGVPEMIKNGQNGFLCSAVSAAAIVEAMEKFVQADKSVLSKNARQFALVNFSQEKIVPTYTEIYSEVKQKHAQTT